MHEINPEALSRLKLQLEHRPIDKKGGTEANIVAPIVECLLETLGFGQLDRVKQYQAGTRPRRTTDIACGYPDDSGQNLFARQCDPLMLVELKSTNYQLETQHRNFWESLTQLREQLTGNKSRTARFGLLSNGFEVQMFRRYKKIIHPVTPTLSLDVDSAEQVSKTLLNVLQKPQRGIIIGVYNNKGGIGKTTITTNIGLVLAQKNLKVLLVDFDPNQADLTNLLNVELADGEIVKYLNHEISLTEVIRHYSDEQGKQKVNLDVLPADQKFSELDDAEIRQKIRIEALRGCLLEASESYDYILVDMPPNWRWFAKTGVFSADALIVPANHIDRSSLNNLEDLVTKFIPEISQWRDDANDGSPFLLPLVLNRYQRTFAQDRNCKAFLDEVINRNSDWKEIFKHFFFIQTGRFGGHRCLELSNRVEISRSPLEGPRFVPAPLRYKRAREEYEYLIKEVLIDE